jgi:hypothetical protein
LAAGRPSVKSENEGISDLFLTTTATFLPMG